MKEDGPTAQRQSVSNDALVIAAVIVIITFAVAIVALYALSPIDQRPSLEPLFGALAAAVPASAAAIVAWLTRRQVSGLVRATDEQTEKLETIERQTNGELTEKITHAVAEVVPGVVSDAVIDAAPAALQHAMADRRSTDPPGTTAGHWPDGSPIDRRDLL